MAKENDKAVIGLTARDAGIKINTDKSVKEAGVFFSNISHPYIDGGIVYGGSEPHTGRAKNKGALLDALLNSPEFEWVERVLFIDDSYQNTIQVQNHLWDNAQQVTIVYFTEVENRFYCNYTNEELSILASHQHDHFLDTGYCKSDASVIGETCPILYENMLYGDLN